MTPEIRGELQGILCLLCEGAASEAQQARLEELLEADAECRFLYLEYLDVHAHLLEHALPADVDLMSRATPKADSTRQIVRYGLVALATLAASVLFQVVWWYCQESRVTEDQSGKSITADPLTFVATLIQGADCVWASAPESPQVGPRLPPGILRLRKGIAQIRYDNGADLVLEGPVDLRLDSGTAATVLLGKVVFRADETAVPFDLHTPSSTLVDLGAEYAVSVGPDGEEIHVFDGEVQRTPKAGADGSVPERLMAGEARSYGPAPATPGRPAAYDPARFVRNLANLAPPPVLESAGLLLYEGFDYAAADALLAGKANGGSGWIGSWQPGFARPQVKGDTNVLALNPRESLLRAGSSQASVGGSFDYTGFARYHRRMATAVRMNGDGVYFLSFLVRRHGPQADPINAVAVLLRTSEEVQDGKQDARKRLNVGVGGPNQLFTHLGKVGSRTALPLRNGETYLLVAKIVASRSGADQVFMRVYGPDQAVEREESGGWTVAGPPFHSDLVFDWMEIHINSRTRQTLDEIRIATTWSAATAPWSGQHAGGKGE